MAEILKPLIRCPGCNSCIPPTEKCWRCGWNLSQRLWQAFLDRKREQREKRTEKRTNGGSSEGQV
jgi:hypothetical protein